MALVTYPLNNIEYSAEDAELFHVTRTSGIYAKNSFDYSVTGADNTIVIGTGIGWIKNSEFSGKVIAQKEPISLNMGLPDSVYPRIDAIVICFDANLNKTNIVVKRGVASTLPTAPQVIRTQSTYELHLYHVKREAGSPYIVPSNITDLRTNNNYCGLMVDSITQAVDKTLSLDGVAADAKATGHALSNKAPGDYGLGKAGRFEHSPDTALNCGFYVAPAPSEIASGGNMRGVVLASSATYLTQIWSVNGSLIKRELANGVFGRYEWINPPMQPGVEYRTVERWNNKAVYAKRISCGAAADMKSIEHNLNATSIIRFSGTIRDMPMPFEIDEALYARVAVHQNTIYLREHGFDNDDVQVTLWYTKD